MRKMMRITIKNVKEDDDEPTEFVAFTETRHQQVMNKMEGKFLLTESTIFSETNTKYSPSFHLYHHRCTTCNNVDEMLAKMWDSMNFITYILRHYFHVSMSSY